MRQHTKKPVTMNKIITIYTLFAYIFMIITALIVLYEGFHIRQGSIIKAVGFIVVTILFYHYVKKTKLKEDKKPKEEKEECKREAFYAQRMLERKIAHHTLILTSTILILLIIFGISSGLSFSSRRPSWEYHRDKQIWEKKFDGLESLPDTIPKGAEEITYYCTEFPNLSITITPSFYLRYTLNDTDYKQAKKEIIKQGTLQEKTGDYYMGFHYEPEDIKQHHKDYQTYLFYESYEYNFSGVMLNDKTNEPCYFYARYDIMLDIEK